ncbi:hypothetical protein Csa_023789, partial [Cucumis sativus]
GHFNNLQRRSHSSKQQQPCPQRPNASTNQRRSVIDGRRGPPLPDNMTGFLSIYDYAPLPLTVDTQSAGPAFLFTRHSPIGRGRFTSLLLLPSPPYNSRQNNVVFLPTPSLSLP